ncbi:MAG: fructose-bisphosphatase class II, partial [Anaerolineales bacterium]|nr:fructose-bisphosphatase class II [Anaerolineales bacterium]
MNTKPTRNLALELVRVTEAASLSAGRFMGRGNKEAADKAAVDAMRLVLNSIDMDASIIIGEGEKDEAPMLFNGEKVGTGESPAVDIAVDPIDGTRPLANGFLNSIATVATSPRETMFDPG